MLKRKKSDGLEELHEVKGAGFKVTKKVKGDKSINRRAGLHDKVKYLEGETRVKRRKPLGLKHVRRMRKFAAVASLAVVCGVAVFGVGFFTQGSGEVGHATNIGNPTTSEKPPIGSGYKPTDFTLDENRKYIHGALEEQDYWSSESRTDVYPVVNIEQYVKNYKKYYKGKMISVDCSYSPSLCTLFPKLQYGEQFCQYTGDKQYNDCILTRRSTSNKKADLDKGMYAPWSKTPTPDHLFKKEEFMEKRGLPPLDFSGYILNDQTVLNANDYSVIDNYDGTYSMTLKLNVSKGEKEADEDHYYADHYYKVQMHYNGSLLEDPIIYSTSLTYTFDASWRILKLEVDDSYHTKAMGGIESDCTSHTVTKYSYDEADAQNTFWEDYFEAEFERLAKQSGAYEDENPEEPLDAGTCIAGAFGSVMTEGAIFKVDLSLDSLDLNGAVAVAMKDGALSGLSANLGDILVWLDGKTLYITDGTSKYKLNTDDLSSSKTGEDGVSTQGLTDGLDLDALLGQLAGGEFVHNEETNVATLNSEVELFGLKLALNFEFQKTEDGVELNYVKAEIPLGEKVVKAKLCFGTESDKPAIPEDTAGYQDILNDGITLKISLNANGFTLDGIAKIIMQNGAFKGVVANLDNITVYYDYPHTMLYLSVGDVKYKLNISNLNTGAADAPAVLSSFNINSLLNDILANLTTTESSLGSSFSIINIDALDSVLEAALDIKLFGGLKVDAGLKLDELNVSLSAALDNGEVAVPDVKDYQDILNGDITFDVSLTLITGLADENGNRDEVALEGQVALCLKDGALTELRADFGGLAVYFDFSANELYLRVGTTKVMLDLDEMNLSDASILSSFAGVELDSAVKELLAHLAGKGKVISTNIMLAAVPVWAELDLTEGLSVRAGLSLLGIDAVVKVEVSETALDKLSAEEKEEYIKLSDNILDTVLGELGETISAEVKGELYSYDYKNDNYAKSYDFSAEFALDRGTTEALYIHFNLSLEAYSAKKDSVYFDFLIKEEQVFLSVSKFATTNESYNPIESYNPMNLYLPFDEFANIISMVGAMANINGLSFGDNEEIASAFNQVYALLNSILDVETRLGDTAIKFSSLGESLIPQIFSSLFAPADEEVPGNTGSNGKELTVDLSANYVKSISNKSNDGGKSSLVLVLDSALMYGSKGLDDLTVEVSKGDLLFSSVKVDNVYFGSANESKLNVRLGISSEFEKVATPKAADYFNLTGIDELLKTAVNSATHATTKEEYEAGATTDYLLNTQYYIDGDIGISVLGFNVSITVKNFFVTINEDNTVDFNVSIHHDSFPLVISEKADVDITVKDEMVYMRKTTDGGKTYNYRIMTTDAFMDDIFGQIKYILGFTDRIMNSMSGDSNSSVEFKDFGDYLNIVAGYKFTENNGKAAWTFQINKDLVNGLVGMSLLSSNITVNLNSSLDSAGAYKLDGLSLSGKMFSVITFSAELKYRNAQYIWDNGTDLSGNVVKLNSDAKYGIGGYSWTEILGGTTLEQITKTVNWNKLLRETSGSSYLEYNGSNLKIGTLKYEYAADIEATGFVEFGERQTVLYSSKSVYTVLDKPEIDGVMLPIASGDDMLVGSWSNNYALTDETDANGVVLAMRATYGAVTLTVTSEQCVDEVFKSLGFTAHGYQDDGYYFYTKTYKYDEDTIHTLDDLNNLPTYIFKGYYDASTGKKVDQFVADSSTMLYLDWAGKTVNITYSSDVMFNGANKKEDSVYTLEGSVKYGVKDSLRTPVATGDGNFLGWFLEENGNYTYIADGTALETYVANNYFNSAALSTESVSVNLWAVWTTDIQVDISSASYKGLFSWTLKASGSYSGGELVDGKSSVIAKSAGVTSSASVELCSSNDGANIKEAWDNAGELKSDNSFDLSHQCGSDPGHAGARITVTYSVNGTIIKEIQATDYHTT